MKIYLQASAASVLLCAAMVLFAFASDSVSVLEDPPSPEIAVSGDVYHGETPIRFPDPDLFLEESSEESSVSFIESSESSEVSESSSEPSSEESAVSESSASSAESSVPSSAPSSEPSSVPESSVPSSVVSSEPVSSSAPSSVIPGPEDAPVIDPPSSSTPAVSSAPSSAPSSQPSSVPSSEPSSAPTSEPSVEPSSAPSSTPRQEPSGPSYSTSESASPIPPSSSSSSPSASPSGETVTAIINGKVQQVDLYDYLCKTVEAEMGAFHTEALKAQAVAAYSYIRYENARGAAVSLPQRTPSQKTKDAVSAVLGEAIYYNGKVAFTPYYASSNGWTNPSSEVWGGSFSYLTRVESIHDPSANNRDIKAIFSEERVQTGLEKLLNIDLDGSDPEYWLDIVSVSDSDYVLKVEVTDADGKVHTITGRQVRESVLSFGIRSHSFTVSYDDGTFTFVTNGYGHGCGMSQTGANGYAQDGWSYVEILNHYYPGTTVR